MEDLVRFMLEKLRDVAATSAKAVASQFIRPGGLDLANFDPGICKGIVTVLAWMAREEALSYPDVYKPEILQIIRRWRANAEID